MGMYLPKIRIESSTAVQLDQDERFFIMRCTTLRSESSNIEWVATESASELPTSPTNEAFQNPDDVTSDRHDWLPPARDTTGLALDHPFFSFQSRVSWFGKPSTMWKIMTRFEREWPMATDAQGHDARAQISHFPLSNSETNSVHLKFLRYPSQWSKST